MADRKIRYSPHVIAEWVRTFTVMTRWGYNTYTPMSDVVDNVGIIGGKERIDVDEDSKTEVKTAYQYETLAHTTQDKTPTLWIERNLGVLMLRPKDFRWTYVDTTLTSAHTWPQGGPGSGGTYPWQAPEGERAGIWMEEEADVSKLSLAAGNIVRTSTKLKVLHMSNTNTANTTRTITSSFTQPEKSAFCIVVGLPAKATTQDATPECIISFWGESYKIKWVRGSRPVLLDGQDNVLETIRLSEDDITELHTQWKQQEMKIYAFMVQYGFHSLIISNGIQMDSKKSEKDVPTSRNFVWREPTIEAATKGLAAPESQIGISTKGGEAFIAYLPVEYWETGKLQSQKFITGYAPSPFKMYLNSIPSDPSGKWVELNGMTKIGDTEITKEKLFTGSEETAGYKWNVTLKRVSDDGTDVPSRTPLLFGVEFDGNPVYAQASFLDTTYWPDMSNDIISCEINETVQEKTCRLTLWNRGGGNIPGGKYKNLHGEYPITVKIGQQEGNPRVGDFTNAPTGAPRMYQHMYGFVTGIDFSRPDAAQSTVTLTITDRKIQLVEAFAINLPIYDGWNHIDAIKDIANRGGFQSNFDIVVEMETQHPGNLPISGLMKEPLYMFNIGTTIWECLEKVRQWSQWWMYCDHNGKLRYRNPGWPDTRSPAPTRKFTEVPNLGASNIFDSYNELKRTNVVKVLSETVNCVFVQGMDYKYRIPQPIWAIERDSLTDTKKRGYVAWNRYQIIQDAALNDPGAVQSVAFETWKRASRPRFTISFDAWGQPDLYPLDVIEIEEKDDETGIQSLTSTTRHFRIVSIVHSLNKEAGSYTSSIEGEWIDSAYTYDPYWR